MQGYAQFQMPLKWWRIESADRWIKIGDVWETKDDRLCGYRSKMLGLEIIFLCIIYFIPKEKGFGMAIMSNGPGVAGRETLPLILQFKLFINMPQ